MTCGLCGHRAHPPNRCAAVYVVHPGHSTAIADLIDCPCWLDHVKAREAK